MLRLESRCPWLCAAFVAGVLITGCGGRVTLVGNAAPASDATKDALVTVSDAASSDAIPLDSGKPPSDSTPPEDSGASCEEMYQCSKIPPHVPCDCGYGLMMSVDCDVFDAMVLPLLAGEPLSWQCPGNAGGDACAGSAKALFCYTMTFPCPPSWLSLELHQVLCDLAAQGLAELTCQPIG